MARKCRRVMAKKSNYLCKISELTDPDSRGFSLKIKRKMTDIFIVRKGKKVYGYENSCPHAQAPLEWNPDQFLDDEKKFIVCAMHGATFTIDEGECASGPCNGVGLTQVALELIDEQIYIAD